MKKLFSILIFVTLTYNNCNAQTSVSFRPFRFAFVSDTHIGSPDGSAEEDLRRTVRDINLMKDSIQFVVITGDITELGTNEELLRARQILDSLQVKYYIIPGNHDTGWSESAGMMFTSVFGYDKFSFEFEGIRFLGCPSGPYLRMSDGHIPHDDIDWLDAELGKLKSGQPVIFLNHYPINDQLDNWYEVTDRLRHFNTMAILCGHGHTNKAFDFEDIPGVMGRSNLRAKAAYGGYNLVDVRSDSMVFSERRPGLRTFPSWTSVAVTYRKYDTTKHFKRPDYSINSRYRNVKEIWTFSSPSNILSSALVSDKTVLFGNRAGEVYALSLYNGRKRWMFKADGPVCSYPIQYKGSVVFGSADGYVYNISFKEGALYWKAQTHAPVLGFPVISGPNICVGNAKRFIALDFDNGKEVWSMPVNGPVMGYTTMYDSALIFGAWDTYLYCVNSRDGQLRWKWSNGSAIRNYSPASCIPIVIDGVVYVVAPDRYISAIDEKSGKTLWRNNDATVRESNGFSLDGKWIYAKTMQDTIVAYSTSRTRQTAAWKMNCGFGYEHAPSMLIEKEGFVFFGTRNGVVYCIDPEKKEVVWAHKVDNSMVHTVSVIDRHKLVVTTMDGKLVLLQADGY